MEHFSPKSARKDESVLIEEARGLRDRLSHLLKSWDRESNSEEHASPIESSSDAERIHAILKARRHRDRFFEEGLFADPAWDMLLELYAAQLCSFRISVSSLCLAAAVPATTALRWIKVLEEKGLVQRSADPLDGRRVFVSLSENATTTMRHLMQRVPLRESLI
jgi:DNA-binding MarR family transcriptional regulator